jgi:FKBP-type peptidyl-prolyl cis-trans isomerase
VGDVVEVSYQVFVNTGDGRKRIDGPEKLAAAGAPPSDDSLFLILGAVSPPSQSQSPGLPLGWDVGLRGACVGERRRILLPPVLAFGKGNSGGGVDSDKLVTVNGVAFPSSASVEIDVRLLSLNGVA